MKKFLSIVLALMMFCSACAFADDTVQYSLTTGLPTDKPYNAFAVQFDNTPAARPQKGMSSADVIYEAELANGGYTRYTAIFNDVIPEEVEAVRSARILHADIALDWTATFVHFGGQQMAGSSVYDYFKTVDINRFDGLSDSKNFYRDSNRVAPYNVVGRLEQMYNATEPRAAEEIHTPMTFSIDNPTIKGENMSVFRIPYSIDKGFYPSYEYLPEDGAYIRYYNREDMRDGATDGAYKVENVIVMYADYSWFDGASDRPIVALTGTNKCEYFIGGKHFSGTWSRNSTSESTTYLDDEGNEVVFKAGKTFVQIVKPEVEIEYVK